MNYFIILLVFFTSTITKSNNHNIQKTKDIKYLHSQYKTDIKDQILFARTVKNKNNIYLIEGKITFNNDLNTIQKITNKTVISSSNVNATHLSFKQKGYRDKFDNYDKVIFVQIQPTEATIEDVLDKRHYLEEKIDTELSKQALGEWIAGDIGPGGANMLFEVSDWNNSINIIMKVSAKEQLLTHCLIAKRLYTAKDNWNYEIIYPISYDGLFNQM